MKNYSIQSTNKVFWNCEKITHHIWQSVIYSRNNNKNVGCPICSNKIICPIDQCNSLYYNCNDQLKQKWSNKNKKSMKEYFPGSEQIVIWKCTSIEHHEWNASLNAMTNSSNGCRICSNNVICPIDQCNSLYYNCNDQLKQEWNEEKNGSMKNYTKGTHKFVFWKCLKNHEWNASINKRNLRGDSCSKCYMCPSCKLWRTMGKLCAYCKPKNNKLKKKTKELGVVKFLKNKLPDQNFIHNKSVGSECTGTHLFPDILFECGTYNLIIEIDEFKHRGASYKCDEKRMYDIIAKCGIPCIFIRYNPDSKNSDKNILLDKINYYLNIDKQIWNTFGFKVNYLFY